MDGSEPHAGITLLRLEVAPSLPTARLATNRVRTARAGVLQRFASDFARGLALRLAASPLLRRSWSSPIRFEALFALKHSWDGEPAGLPYAITLPPPSSVVYVGAWSRVSALRACASTRE